MNEAELLKQELDYETALTLIQRDHRTAWQRIYLFVVCTLVSGIIFLYAVYAKKDVVLDWPLYLPTLLSAVIGVAAFVRLGQRLPENVILRDTRLIEPLLNNLHGSSGERSASLRLWLFALLPKMTEQDASTLSKLQQHMLIEELFCSETESNEEYRLIVLASLQHTANPKALAKVRWLAEAGKDHGYSEAVCTAAREVIPRLETLIEEREKRTGLLLPSSAEEVGSAALLRASVPQAVTTDAAQLLRADSVGHYDL